MAKMSDVLITAQDMRNQAFIHDPLPAAITGAPPVSRDVKELLMQRDVKLQCDIIAILGVHAIVAMVRPMSLGMGACVDRLTAAVLRKGLLMIDPEKSLVKAGGLLVTEVAPGHKVPDAEKLIQDTCSIARPPIHSL